MPRPSKATAWLAEDRLKLISHWKRNGLKDEEIAKNIGIRNTTLSEWKKRYPEINEALKKGFEELALSAEEALLSRFEIQTITEEKEEIWQDPNGGIKKHKTVTKKQVLPDTTAIIFFLKSTMSIAGINSTSSDVKLPQTQHICCASSIPMVLWLLYVHDVKQCQEPPEE